MRNKFVKILIIVPVLAGLVCAFVFTPLSSWLIKAGGTVFSPIQSGIARVSASVSGWFEYRARLKSVDAVNQELLAKIDVLEQENRDFEQFKKENESLRSLLDLKGDYDGISSEGAFVTGKDGGNWFQLFNINKGTSTGVVKNSPVVNAKGLIGRTLESGYNWSKVISIIDPEHSVSGVVSRTGDMVQIDGDLNLMKSGLCKMSIITEGADIMIGDTIETSGIGGVYPRGILIGTVTEFKNNEEGAGNYGIVRPSVDMQRLKEVLVLKMPAEAEEVSE